MQHHPRVAIVGGGPAGLTLANLLHQNQWSVVVFEADDSPTSRDQGGTLDLHLDGGQAALRQIGLLDRFLASARHEDQGERDIDYATGAVLEDAAAERGAGDRPEIDRVELRRLLLEPLGHDVVRWSSPVAKVEPSNLGGYGLKLRTGGVAGPFDLVVGADGAWSRVRPLLTSAQPSYTGVTFVELWLADVDNRHSAISQLVGRGTMFSLHDGLGIIAQRNGNASIRVYAAFRTEPKEVYIREERSSHVSKQDLLSRFKGWAPSLLGLITDADSIAATRPIIALPVGLRWPSTPSMTLVGDAAHVMPPLGTGVNLAMWDAAELGEALIASSDWRDGVRAYEIAMYQRAESAARRVNQGFAMMFATDGAAPPPQTAADIP